MGRSTKPIGCSLLTSFSLNTAVLLRFVGPLIRIFPMLTVNQLLLWKVYFGAMLGTGALAWLECTEGALYRVATKTDWIQYLVCQASANYDAGILGHRILHVSLPYSVAMPLDVGSSFLT